jgi:hypothetical protein
LKEEYLWHHQVMFLGGQISRPGDKKQEQQTVEKRFFLVFGGENGPMSWHYEGKWGPCGQMAIIRQQDRRIWLSPLLDCHELTYLMNLGWGGVRLGAGGGEKTKQNLSDLFWGIPIWHTLCSSFVCKKPCWWTIWTLCFLLLSTYRTPTTHTLPTSDIPQQIVLKYLISCKKEKRCLIVLKYLISCKKKRKKGVRLCWTI